MSGKKMNRKAVHDSAKAERKRLRKEQNRKARVIDFETRRESHEKKKSVVGDKLAAIREAAIIDEDEYPPTEDPIFDTEVTPEFAPLDYNHLPSPPKPGQAFISMGKRSYTPPVWRDEPGGGGPIDYYLFPGVMGYAVLKKDGSIWVCTPEPEEQHHRMDWAVVQGFLDALHERCRVVNCVWGELLQMLVNLGWINRPELVVSVSDGKPREIDVWYPPREGHEGHGYVDGGLGEVSNTPFPKD